MSKASSNHHRQDDRHIYFELEKQEEAEEMEEDGGSKKPNARLKGQTLASANVKVAERARMFETGNLIVYTHPETKGNQAGTQDGVYDVPPALKRTAENDRAPKSKKSVDSGPALTRDEGIYEFTFDSDRDESGRAASFHSSGEGSGVYEVLGKPVAVRVPAPNTTVYELAKPMLTNSESKGVPSLSAPAADLSGSGGFMRCKQGTVRQEHVQGVAPTQQEIETEYNRLHFGRNPETNPTPQEAGYYSLNRLSPTPKGIGITVSIYIYIYVGTKPLVTPYPPSPPPPPAEVSVSQLLSFTTSVSCT